MNLVRMNLTESLKEYDKACAQHHAAASRVKREPEVWFPQVSRLILGRSSQTNPA